MTISAPQIGKTLTLSLWILSGAWRDGGRVPWPSWWTAPTYDQVRHGFLMVVDHARAAGIRRDHTTAPPLKLKLVNGSVIEARSWENAEGLYGPTPARIASDEFGFLTTEAQAALSSRLTESRVRGLGYWRLAGNVTEIGGEAESMWNMAKVGRDGWACRTWTWRHRAASARCDCPNVRDPMSLDLADAHGRRCERGLYLRAVAERRDKLSPAHFRQLYEAEWVDWSALPAYEFDRAIHVTPRATYSPHLPLDLSCDFNVDPMGWVVGQAKPTEAWALAEIAVEGGATTYAACDAFLARFPGSQTQELRIFGDASGRASGTRSTKTDYQIIRERLLPRWPRMRFMVPASNPPVPDRLNAFNALLRSASGVVRYHVHPDCQRLANDLARVSLKPGTRDLDKRDKRLTHFSDAEGYRVHRLFPVRGSHAGTRSGHVRVERITAVGAY